MSFPIETARLLIQPLTPADAEQIHIVWSDPEVMRWIPGGPLPTLDATRQKIERFMTHQDTNGFSLWAVREKVSGTIVGDCGLLLVEWTGPEVELAYRFGRKAWGKGYATEAARACLRYGLDVLHLECIIAVTDPAHGASRRVMEKCGLRYAGTASYYGQTLVRYETDGPVDSAAADTNGAPIDDRAEALPTAPRVADDRRARPDVPATTLSPEQAAFLEHQRSGRLATVDPSGQPHAVPICYALLDGQLYTPIDEKPKTGDPRELRRIRNILANPKVCLVVDQYEDEDWSRLAWLQVRGQAALVEDAEERRRAHAALRARYRQYRAMALEGLPLLRITPTRLVGWSGAR